MEDVHFFLFCIVYFSRNEPWKTGIENQGQLNICSLLGFHLPTSSVTLISKASCYNTNILEPTYNFPMLSTDTVHWGGWRMWSCPTPDSDKVLCVGCGDHWHQGDDPWRCSFQLPDLTFPQEQELPVAGLQKLPNFLPRLSTLEKSA